MSRYSFIWGLGNLQYRLRNLGIFNKKATGSLVVFVVDDSKKHPGLLDILKGVVGSYYISLINGMDFRLRFTSPFKLSDYLIPNKTDWLKDDVSYSFWQVKMLNYFGIGAVPSLKKGYQYHIYNFSGWNILQRNNVDGWEKIWTDCFQNLFKASPSLEKQLSKINYDENGYVSVHVRFVNAIEILEPKYRQSQLLNEERQSKLVNAVLTCIESIKKKENKPIIVFSDSNKFLTIAIKQGYMVLPGTVQHIKYHSTEDAVMKTFVDLFAIGRGLKVYSIMGENLYASVFPFYASLIQGKPFERINY